MLREFYLKKYIYTHTHTYIYIYRLCFNPEIRPAFFVTLKKMASGTLWTENASADVAASLIMTMATDFPRPETV